ncbi:CDP-paratose 2-epimerase [Yersinia pseudotuberculosis]|nr:CDP-paratose 2-epimerase [Yersinia pseudotuberculosis]CNI30789.1 CDP-paratose 2-epimerase [Yersinia pseudotuberculosis]VEE73012.1 CDP-paratose 2-epimerase [Yersinia pseudotuberculosis]
MIVPDDFSHYEINLKLLQLFGDFIHVHCDILNRNDVTRLIRKFKSDDLFHLTSQVAMTTSIDNPSSGFQR